MRALVVLIAIAGACDLQPAPKQAPPAATPPTTPVAPDPGTPPPVAPIDASDAVPVAVADAPPAIVKPPVVDVTEQCISVGSHVAEIFIDEAQDPSKKSIMIQERSKIVRRTAESCTRDAWNAELIACYMKAKSQVTMQACRQPDAPAGAAPR